MKKTVHLSVQERVLFNIAAKGGLPNSLLSKVFNVPLCNVSKERPKNAPGMMNGVTRASLQEGIPLHQLREIIAREYRNGARIDYLVGKYHTHYDVVHRILESEGVRIRPARRPAGAEIFRRVRSEGPAAFATIDQLNQVWNRVRKVQ